MTSFARKSIYAGYRQMVAHPRYRWWMIGGTLLYLLSPIDIAPDFLPFVGQIDDAVIVTVLATEIMQMFKNRHAAMSAKTTPKTMPEMSKTEVITVEATVVP